MLIPVLFVLAGFAAAEYSKILDRPIAIVLRFKPTVIKKNNDVNFNLDPKENKAEQLFSGDTLATASDGYAAVKFMDNSTAKVKPNSMLVIMGEVAEGRKQFSTRIDLAEGDIFLEVEPQGTSDYEVSTNNSVATVKGTKLGTRATGYYWVTEGEIDVTALNSGQTVSVGENMFAQVDPGGNEIETGQLDEDDLKELGEGFNTGNSELKKKTIILRFIDSNGQVQEETIEYYEEQN